jgi:TonB family protein
VISIVGVPEGHSGIVDFQGGGESRKLEKMVVPDMPEDIKSAGNPEYRVVISFRVDSEGLATGFTYKGHSLNSEVDAAVLEALRRWTFSRAPAGQNGKMLEATLTYVIEIK